jgi:hypothetical protein
MVRVADCATHKTSDHFKRALAAVGVNETSKKVWAQRMAAHLQPTQNRSPSFNVFASGLLDLVARG